MIHTSVPPARLAPSPIFSIHILPSGSAAGCPTPRSLDFQAFPNPRPSTWNAPPHPHLPNSFTPQLRGLRVQKVLPGAHPSWVGCSSNSVDIPNLAQQLLPNPAPPPLIPHCSGSSAILFSQSPTPPTFTWETSLPSAAPPSFSTTTATSQDLLSLANSLRAVGEPRPVCCHLVAKGICHHVCQCHSPAQNSSGCVLTHARECRFLKKVKTAYTL